MISKKMRPYLLFTLVLTFGVLIFGGYLTKREKPPIPATVVTVSAQTGTSRVVLKQEDITNGQNYYLSRGGQNIGTIWGHGSYLAPDWSADYLHREALYVAARHHGLSPERAAGFTQTDFDALSPEIRAVLTARVQQELRTNRYDAASATLTLTPYRAEAFENLNRYYTDLFKSGNEAMGLQPGIVKTDEQGRWVASFFSWLAWAAVTERPGLQHSYTSNWPFDPLVGNTPLPGSLIWSIVSVVLLILGVAAVIFAYVHFMKDDERSELVLKLPEPKPTPSQKATLLYFGVAMALFVVQVLTGALTGHFTIEGTKLFGINMADILPYAAVRTWHLQLSVFWIATCFLAAGLFIGPFVGREPTKQAFWVKVLFGAIVVVVVGALSGTWLSATLGAFGKDGFWLGHQGYEYVELGRLWQLLLIGGMLIWLVLVARALAPSLKAENDSGGLVHLLLYSSVTIPLFYMAGLMYGKGTHLSEAEYWRWWVVHLWVEGFFEVFATVVLAFILSKIGAITQRSALINTYFSIFLYLGAGVIGTFHHLYWTGTPTPIVALGAVFSALEIIPLTVLGFEASKNLSIVKQGGAAYPYKWPILFFVAVAFWNMVGAGFFGFLINPPIILYYVQGINLTPIHSHTALFGVYGFLAIALMLFSMRHIVAKAAWSDKLLKWSFWGLNGGLVAMTVLSLVPAGFYQFYYAVKYGMWYARSPEIAAGPVIRALAWLRIGPDLIFAGGALILFVFVFRAAWLTLSKGVLGREIVTDERGEETYAL